MKPPASEKEKPEALAEQAKKLAAALARLVREEIAAEQKQHRLADRDARKYRALHQQERHEAARRRRRRATPAAARQARRAKT